MALDAILAFRRHYYDDKFHSCNKAGEPNILVDDIARAWIGSRLDRLACRLLTINLSVFTCGIWDARGDERERVVVV